MYVWPIIISKCRITTVKMLAPILYCGAKFQCLYFQDFALLTCDQFKRTGMLMVYGIRPNDIDQLTASVFKECVGDNLEVMDGFGDAFAKGVRHAVIRRVRTTLYSSLLEISFC